MTAPAYVDTIPAPPPDELGEDDELNVVRWAFREMALRGVYAVRIASLCDACASAVDRGRDLPVTLARGTHGCARCVHAASTLLMAMPGGESPRRPPPPVVPMLRGKVTATWRRA